MLFPHDKKLPYTCLTSTDRGARELSTSKVADFSLSARPLP